jgi:hypothetical protein
VISCSALLAPLRYNCGWMTGFKYLDTLVPVLVVVSVKAAASSCLTIAVFPRSFQAMFSPTALCRGIVSHLSLAAHAW